MSFGTILIQLVRDTPHLLALLGFAGLKLLHPFWLTLQSATRWLKPLRASSRALEGAGAPGDGGGEGGGASGGGTRGGARGGGRGGGKAGGGGGSCGASPGSAGGKPGGGGDGGGSKGGGCSDVAALTKHRADPRSGGICPVMDVTDLCLTRGR